MKTYQKGFVIPLLIAIVAVIALGGGLYFYKNKKVEAPINNPVANSTNVATSTATTTDSTTGWKTYTNTQYGFQVSYPADWRVDSTSPSNIYLISSATDKMVKDWPNQPATQRTDLKISVEPYLYRPTGVKKAIMFNGMKAEQVTEESEEGISKLIYLDKDVITYQITAANSNIEDTILGSFKFTTPTAQIIYKDQVNGYQIKLPADWVGYKVVDGSFFLPTTVKDWCDAGCGYARVFSILKYSTEDWNAEQGNCGKPGWPEICLGDGSVIAKSSATVFVRGYSITSSPEVLGDTKWGKIAAGVSSITYLKNNFSVIPTVTIISPKGGEILTAGNDYLVNWWDDRDAGNTTIYLISSTVESNAILTNSFSRSSGIDGTFGYQWKVSGSTIPGSYKLKICKSETNECGISDIFVVENTTNQTLSLWPNVNSFDLVNNIFEAKGIGKDAQTVNNIKVYINSSTKFSSKDTQTSMSSFQDMYTMLKNWVGPEWWFTVKGVMQNDGSIVASEISIAVQ